MTHERPTAAHDIHGTSGRPPKDPQLVELDRWVREGSVETLIVAFADMQGRLMGKRVTAGAFLGGVIDHGVHFCTYLLGTDMEMSTPDGFRLMNWETGYGDWMADPVWSTLRTIPWLERTALVLGDVVEEETRQAIPIAPRTILKRQVAAARDLGFVVKAGSEFEYYLLTDQWDDLHRRGWPVPETFGYYNEDYHLLQATKAEPYHGRLRSLMSQARIPIEFSKGEAAPGQHEVNIRYDEVLESADRSVIFKHGAKEIAYLNGYGLTFMAKPDHRWTGSSGHLHMSLWSADGRTPLFHDPAGEPYGMSQLMRWFVGGMMQLSRELAIFLAPNVNSYKRFAALSWAPVNVVWGRDNRTTGFRVVGHGPGLHVEDRFPGADMNAYLTYAAAVGAGLWGIRHQVELPPEYKGNGYVATGCDRMPRSLWEAIQALERSEAAVEIFGQDVVDHYLNMARVEQSAYDQVVTAWERERYLERS
ncbi:MAG: glutamine synthetase family protein [Chloroflexi bacterium]|jgi:glutamine synthetase|nr:glutamine synthetase family protein [Chloroflexota bacterium]